MMPWLPGRRSAPFIGVALLALAMIAPGCGRPLDEAWLQFLGFKQGGATISVFKDSLREESTVTADVEFENGSLNVGQKTGTGILVNRARIDYRMPGFSPPSAEYPLNLYLPPPAEGAATTGTLTGFPLAPTSLKQWIVDTGSFEDGAAKPVVDLTARVTFFGLSDAGVKLETEGNIGITLTNTGGIAAGTKPTVNVYWTRNASKTAAESGAFTVIRVGSVGANLTVTFSTTGDATSADYNPIGPTVVIPAGLDSIIIPVTALSGATISRTVKITLSSSVSYTLGTHYYDSLTIIP